MSAPFALVTADVVNEIFAKFQSCLPEYVPAMPSIILGMIVTGVMLVAGVVAALVDRHLTRNKQFVVRVRWIVLVIVAVVVSSFVGTYVQERHYTIRCITTNRQHYANVHWLRAYSLSLQGKPAI